MSIVDEITRLTSAKADIKAAIEAKGVSVPSTAHLDAFPSYVSAISGGGGGVSIDDIAMKSLSGAIVGSGATSIRAGAFQSFSYITGASFPNVTYLSNSAFTGCSRIAYASFPKASFIGINAFRQCSALSEAYFPLVETLRESAFALCGMLSSVSFPLLRSVFASALEYTAISMLSFPLITAVGYSSVFAYMSSLELVNLPAINRTYHYMFWSDINLRTVYMGKNANSSTFCVLYPSVFGRCYNLLSLYLLHTQVMSLSHINAFSSTPISNYTASTGGVNGSIFVRASLLDAYKTATNWATYSSRFVGLTDEEIAALPI